MKKSALLLGFFAFVSVIFVVGTNILTKDAITENDKQRLLSTINEIVPKSAYDNDLTTTTISLPAKLSGLEQDAIVYVAAKEGQATHAIFNITTYRAYGVVNMLIGLKLEDQSLSGVRVVSHTETPGLGDKIEVKKSDWILSFKGKSLNNPKLSGWAVKKDGGQFDQFTGATITPRSIVNMVRSVLLFSKDKLNPLIEHYLKTQLKGIKNG